MGKIVVKNIILCTVLLLALVNLPPQRLLCLVGAGQILVPKRLVNSCSTAAWSLSLNWYKCWKSRMTNSRGLATRKELTA